MQRIELRSCLDGAICHNIIQNWSDNVYNLVTKRAKAQKDATVGVGSTELRSQDNHEVTHLFI